MQPRKKSPFPYQDDLRFFLPEKKIAYQAELPQQEYVDTFLTLCKELENTAAEVKDLEQKSNDMSRRLTGIRYPKLDIASKPLLLEFTRAITKNIDRASKSKLLFTAKIDIFSEKIILTIKRHDKHELSVSDFKKYADNIRKYFSALVGAENLSLIDYKKNKYYSKYEVRVNYLLLISLLDRAHKNEIISKQYLSK